MDRLSGFVRRRRRLVLGVWIVLLLASVPFASRQTENLTGGGFEVPNTGSVAVEHEIDRFRGVSADPLAVVLEDRGGGDVGAAIDRVRAAAARVDGVTVPDAAPGSGRVVLVPLQVAGARDDVLDAAKDLRTELHVGSVTDGVQAYLVGQQALWAGHAGAAARRTSRRPSAPGFPIVLLILLAVFGSLAGGAAAGRRSASSR